MGHAVKHNDDKLTIEAIDESAPGGANCEYVIRWQGSYEEQASIRFQRGTRAEVGVNGVTNEALLAIVIDRLQGYQSGVVPCEENNKALHHLTTGLRALIDRTARRQARGVEGTMEK